LLRAGSLAAPMDIIEERTVGPSMGQENINRGVKSTIWGFIAIVFMMSIYYMGFGLVSVIGLTVNLLFLVALLSAIQATLTLPGIAAIALTLGMAIDANVLINERIRDEIRNGNTPQASIHIGYEKAWGTILDSNITTMIAGLALFMFGSGPIKGFAVVHVLGILTSMYSSNGFPGQLLIIFMAIDVILKNCRSERFLKWITTKIMEIFRVKKDIPFMKYSKISVVVSILTFLLSVTFLFTSGLNLGVDFTGGTIMEVSYPDAPDVQEIRKTLESIDLKDAQVQNFGTAKDILIRLPIRKDQSIANLSSEVTAALKLDNSLMEVKRIEAVGSQVGDELYENGALAILFVCLGIVLYLSMRFEWRFAIAAIIANMHDVIIILGFFAFFQWEFNLTVLAAVLAVLGYSVNESVVVFDRVRENFKKMRKASVAEVINNAITRTMSRTIMTHLSTQTVVISMLIFGGEILHNFSLALTIGILFGIYSSIMVGCPMAMWLGTDQSNLVGNNPEGDQKNEGVV